MNTNTTNEGVVNNSSQPSQTEKLTEMINTKVNSLTEKLGKIGNEINELKKIKVTDDITKISSSVQDFKIEDFIKEPDPLKLHRWMEVKKQIESDQDEVLDEIKERMWEDNWREYMIDNTDSDDYDPWEYISIRDIVNEQLETYDSIVDGHKGYYEEDLCEEELLTDYINDHV